MQIKVFFSKQATLRKLAKKNNILKVVQDREYNKNTGIEKDIAISYAKTDALSSLKLAIDLVS